ncbi:Xylooligosaccharide oxidase [Paramyrothecium foliicola]|nr:Xylooligosaccharide oxidase [Paramyrothecium foliicola]
MRLNGRSFLGVTIILPLVASVDVKSDIGTCLNSSRVDYVGGNFSDWGGIDRSLFNQRLQFKPVLIALPTNTSQVQAAVSCGVKSGVKVNAKCGGHGYAATAFGGEDGHLVIDLGKMNKTTVGTGFIAKIQAGARLGSVATELFNQGKRAIAHGTCPGVGISGHVLGGGYGMASHSHGLALDWLTSATVVLANSSVVRASDTENPDLFWALRGAGSSFGVVTEYEFRTFPAPANVTYYTVSLNWNETTMVSGLKALQTFAAAAMPPELNMRLALNGFSRSLEGVYHGSIENLRSAITPLMNQTNGRLTLSRTVSWMDSLKYYAYGTEMVPTKPYSQHELFYSSSLTTNALTDTQLKSFANYLFKEIGSVTGRTWWIQIDLHGGPNSTISKTPNNATSYAHRDKLLLYQLYDRVFSSAYPANGFELVQGMANSITKNMNTSEWGMYINYPDTEVHSQTAQQKYWGTNLPKLKQIKAVVDPNEPLGPRLLRESHQIANPQTLDQAQYGVLFCLAASLLLDLSNPFVFSKALVENQTLQKLSGEVVMEQVYDDRRTEGGQLDPQLTAIIPLRPPPEGVISNFDSTASRGIIAAATIYATTPLMLAFVTLRVIARLRLKNPFSWDDYLCILAAICVIGHCAVILAALDTPGNGLLGRHDYDFPLSRLTPFFLQSLFTIIELYMAASLFIKTSLLFLYLRLFKPAKSAKRMIWTGIMVVVMGYLGCMGAEIAVCVPHPGDIGGWLSTQLLVRCNKPQVRLNMAQAIFSVVSDAYVLFLPLHFVARLKLSRGRKIAVGAVFLIGLLSLIACIICAFYRFEDGDDKTWTFIPALAAGVVELNIGVIPYPPAEGLGNLQQKAQEVRGLINIFAILAHPLSLLQFLLDPDH